MLLKTTLKTATLAVAVFVWAFGSYGSQERILSDDTDLAALLDGATARNTISRQFFESLIDGPGSHARTIYSSGGVPGEGLWTVRSG